MFLTKKETKKLDLIKKIVEEKQFQKINGIVIDGFSASAILQLYHAVNEENKKKFIALPIEKMASIAFKFCK